MSNQLLIKESRTFFIASKDEWRRAIAIDEACRREHRTRVSERVVFYTLVTEKLTSEKLAFLEEIEMLDDKARKVFQRRLIETERNQKIATRQFFLMHVRPEMLCVTTRRRFLLEKPLVLPLVLWKIVMDFCTTPGTTHREVLSFLNEFHALNLNSLIQNLYFHAGANCPKDQQLCNNQCCRTTYGHEKPTEVACIRAVTKSR